MMRLIALSLLVVLAGPAVAEERDSAARYAFVPVETGALRLDTVTGEVSLCVGGDGESGCTRLSESTRGDAEELAHLEARVAALEARIAALEARGADGVEALPDDEAMDRVMALTERMMRRFFAMVREFKRDMEGEEL